jgi:hypothetical protein
MSLLRFEHARSRFMGWIGILDGRVYVLGRDGAHHDIVYAPRAIHPSVRGRAR